MSPATETLTFEPADQYRIEAEAFAQAVAAGAAPPIDPSEGVADLVVIEALVAAAT